MLEPIYVVNLARDTDRRQWIASELAKLGLTAQFVPAVLGKSLSELERQQLYSDSANRESFHSGLTPGEIGCYASHIKIWQTLLASESNWALVLEDDMKIAPSLNALLRDVRMQLNAQHWDMIKLIGRSSEAVRAQTALGEHQLVRYRRVPSLTGAYLLSRAGAEKLLRTRVPFARPVDVDLRFWWENDLRIFGITPYPCIEAPIGKQSSIGMRAEKQLPGYRLRRTRFNFSLNVRNLVANWRSRSEQSWPFR
jgi:glycosyl transferase, family 25